MTASASSRLASEHINTALIAICSNGDFVRDPPLTLGGAPAVPLRDLGLGRVLCEARARGVDLASFKEIAISTGKSHGAFFQPLTVWMGPLREWIASTNR